MQLQGKRIVVTGGGSGMGAATVRAYAAEGAAVAVLDVNDEAAEKVIAEVSANGDTAPRFYRADIGRRDQVDAAFDAAAGDLGGIDVLANVAGVQRGKPAAEFTDADLDFLIDINLRGTILTNQAAYRHMNGNGYGNILNFGSDAGLGPIPGVAAYAATKGGVMAWTRTVAAEWAKAGVRVNSIVPAMLTPMTEAGQRDRADVYASIPLGGLGDVEADFAPVMVFMAGDGARFITGQIIACNGGLGMVR